MATEIHESVIFLSQNFRCYFFEFKFIGFAILNFEKVQNGGINIPDKIYNFADFVAKFPL